MIPQPLSCVLSILALLTSAGRAQDVDFNREIRPILAEHCFACHGPDSAKRKAELRLDNREGAIEAAVVPQDSAASELIHRVTSEDPDEQMPPVGASQKRLSSQQIKLLRQWIDGGARYDEHWSFVAPKRSELPTVDNSRWRAHAIDRFAAANHSREKIESSAEADRGTLIRRLSLDLTGLPPTVKDVESFLNDESEDAYEKVVDRLLGSRHYGEHRARYWLDAARYADTNGYQYDLERNQWVWRDWVIHAFNTNMPFDKFTIQQLAGDLLQNATSDQRLATGFHRNHPITIEGGVIDEEYRTEYVVDRVVTTSTVWLGLTMRCARCHDHKYDPISQKEFYEFFAYFNQVPEKGLQGFQPSEKIASPLQAAQLALSDQAARQAHEVVDALLSKSPGTLDQWERKATAIAKRSWRQTTPTEVVSEGGATLTRQDDGSFLASGKNPANEVYRYDFQPTEKVYAIRVEALKDPSFTSGGTGRAPNANFVLSELEVLTLDDKGQATKLPISATVADYSQNGYPIESAIDGKLGRQGWAVDGNTKHENRSAYFVLKQSIDRPAGTLRVRMVHQFGGNHQIGRFRISFASQPVSELSGDLVKLLDTPGEKRSAEQTTALTMALARQYGGTELRALIATWDNAVAQRAQMMNFPTTMVMRQMPSPRKTHILYRGLYSDPRDEVTAGTPDTLSNTVGAVEPGESKAALNRLDLAKWIVSPDNPLTARVTVNRLWQQLFGVGIVETPEDFGTQGAYPSHPELLDWLAVDFVESGWDVKKLLKTIVMSQTYRQSSRVTAEQMARDPQNRLLARGPRIRLDAETIRDSALAVSGLLERQLGGPSVFPYHPPGLWQEINNRPGYSRVYKQDQGANIYRRSLYTFWKRTVPPPSLATFDAPGREYCVVRRSRTNTPLQAFVMLNDPQFVESARHLGGRMFRHAESDIERLQHGYSIAFARQPSDRELKILLRTLAERRLQYANNPEDAAAILSVGDTPMPEENRGEHAAWATIGRILLNLSEFITKG